MHVFEVFSRDQHHYSTKFMVLWFSVLTFTHNLCNLKTGQQLLWHFNTVFSDGMFVPVA